MVIEQELMGVGGGDSIAKVSETFQETVEQRCLSVLLKLTCAYRAPADLVTEKF